MLSLNSLQNSLYYSCFFRAILQPHSSPQQPRLLPKFSRQSLLHPKEFCVHLIEALEAKAQTQSSSPLHHLLI